MVGGLLHTFVAFYRSYTKNSTGDVLHLLVLACSAAARTRCLCPVFFG